MNNKRTRTLCCHVDYFSIYKKKSAAVTAWVLILPESVAQLTWGVIWARGASKVLHVIPV